jgi:hypothetical protein
MAQTINIIFGANTVGGTADVITATYSPSLTALTNKRTLTFKATADNTGAVTFSPDGLTVRAVTKKGGTVLVAGDIKQNMICLIQYDLTNTRWELLNPAKDIGSNGLQEILDISNVMEGYVQSASGQEYLYIENLGGLRIGAKNGDVDIFLNSLTGDLYAQATGTFTLDAPNINLPNETASRYLFLDASKNITTKTTADILSEIGAQPLDSDLTTIAGLTATTDNFIQSKSSAWASRTPAQVSADLTANLLIGYQGFSIEGGLDSNTNPADSTIYYIGSRESQAIVSVGGARRMPTPTGTIDKVIIWLRVGGLLGTSENSTFAIRLNNTTDTVLSSTVKLDTADQMLVYTGVNIACTQNDYVELKWTTPAWVTNPANISLEMLILLK